MKESYSLIAAVAAVVVSGIVIYFTRLLPFMAFSRKNPPSVIRFIEKYMPSAIMAVLVIYCFKDVYFSQPPFGLPYVISAAATVVIHLALRNSMVSIFSGTVIFMILSRIL